MSNDYVMVRFKPEPFRDLSIKDAGHITADADGFSIVDYDGDMVEFVTDEEHSVYDLIDDFIRDLKVVKDRLKEQGV